MTAAKTSFSFEIMDAAGYGYYRVWKERAYLLKLAAIPLFIKFACTIAIFALNLDDEILRQGLIMLPAMFAQGWVLAQFLRTLLMNERWPVMLPAMPESGIPDDRVIAKLLLRARGIIASILIYVLLGMVAYMMRYALFELMPSSEEIEKAQTAMKQMDSAPAEATQAAVSSNDVIFGFASLIPTVLGMAAMVWAFRLLWLYIPYSVLMPTRYYLKALSGFMPSVRLLILFFSCMAPVTFVVIMLARVVYGITDEFGTQTAETLGHFITVFLSVSSEIAVGLVTTAAFAWAMKPFLPHAKGAMDDFPKGD